MRSTTSCCTPSPWSVSPARSDEGCAERWGDVATRITLYATYKADPAVWPEVVNELREGAA